MSLFPAGTVRGDPPGGYGVHAIDGDGASLCGELGEDALVQIDDLRWSDIARDHRCGRCQIFMTSLGLEHH